MSRYFAVVLVLLAIPIGIYFFVIKKDSGSMFTQTSPVSDETTPELTASSNYKKFSQAEYENALGEKKVVLLYFFANWCPICREQEPINLQVFESLKNESEIVGFRVNILDSEETSETKALASQFEVTYQHTYVILDKNGEVRYKYTGPLSFESVRSEILKVK